MPITKGFSAFLNIEFQWPLPNQTAFITAPYGERRGGFTSIWKPSSGVTCGMTISIGMEKETKAGLIVAGTLALFYMPLVALEAG